MKKLLICLCVAVAIGLVVGVVGLVAYAASGGKSEIERKMATFEFVGGDKVVVDCQIEDATVVVGNSANVVIEYDCSARNNPTLTKENGVVSYKSDWKRNFFFWNWFDSDYEVKVILPSAFDGDLVAKTTTGDITVSLSNLSLKNLDVQTTTGDLKFSIMSATDISVKATTGDIVGYIYGSEEDFSIDYSVSTGESNLKKRTGGWKSAYFKVTTGDIFVYFK